MALIMRSSAANMSVVKCYMRTHFTNKTTKSNMMYNKYIKHLHHHHLHHMYFARHIHIHTYSCTCTCNEVEPGRMVEKSSDGFKEEWIARLDALGVPEPYWSVKWITEHVQKIVPTETTMGEATFSAKQKDMANKLLKLRSKRIPVQHIIGEWDFRNVTLTMRAPVFIPEPETEELVGHVVKFVEESCNKHDRLKFLDLGCGSGAISIALLNECNNLEGHAVDVSEEAVKLTRENAMRNNVEDRLTVMLSSIQAALQSKQLQRTRFDFIVSNPPYIPTEHIPSLQTEVQKYIDHRALDGGPDGLQIARNILSSCRHVLKEDGQIWLEMGYNHGSIIQELERRNPKWELTYEYCYQDFNNWPRFHQLKRWSISSTSH